DATLCVVLRAAVHRVRLDRGERFRDRLGVRHFAVLLSILRDESLLEGLALYRERRPAVGRVGGLGRVVPQVEAPPDRGQHFRRRWRLLLLGGRRFGWLRRRDQCREVLRTVPGEVVVECGLRAGGFWRRV